jgi:hypothetical protein
LVRIAQEGRDGEGRERPLARAGESDREVHVAAKKARKALAEKMENRTVKEEVGD